MALPLDIYARLSVSLAGQQFDVRADGQLITVEIPKLRTARAFFKVWRTGQGILPRNVMSLLAAHNLQMEFRLNDRIIARLGWGIRPNLSSWLLGLNPLELRPMQMLWAIASRNKR